MAHGVKENHDEEGASHGEKAVFVFFCFFHTSFRDNRTPGTCSATNATQEHAPDRATSVGLVGKRVPTRPLAAEGRLTLNT